MLVTGPYLNQPQITYEYKIHIKFHSSLTVATELHVIGRLKINIRVTPDLHQQDINSSAAQLIFL